MNGEAMPERYDAFLSFAWEDRHIATTLAQALRDEGLEIWRSDVELRLGESIRQSLDQGMSRSRFAIVLLSPSYLRFARSWAQYEFDGIISSEAGGRTVLLPVWLDLTLEDMRNVSPTLAGRMAVHWADGLSSVVRELTKVIRPITKSRRRDRLERQMFNRMYHYRDATATALRLVGASTESFAPNDVLTSMSNSAYELPPKYRDHRMDLLTKLMTEAKSMHKILFDGPAVRMLSYSIFVPDVHTETKALQLVVGPLRYFDYSMVRRISDAAMEDDGVDRLEQFIDIESIAAGGDFAGSSLSNIVDSATTLVTQDGHLFYSRRGSHVGDRGGWHTSAVAENIQAAKDDLDFSIADSQGPIPGVPFRTAIRGVAEELSEELARVIEARGLEGHLRLLGLSFDLEGFHPDLLFLAVVPLTSAEVWRRCREFPGRDFNEGALQSTYIGHGTDDIVRTLARTRWTPGGAASVIRSLEYLEAMARERDLKSTDATIQWILDNGFS